MAKNGLIKEFLINRFVNKIFEENKYDQEEKLIIEALEVYKTSKKNQYAIKFEKM